MTGLWWWLALATGLGLIVGSFLNVVIYRLPRDLRVFRPARSFCPYCETPIRWYDNLPLLSFALRAGRCRQCRSPISLQYPTVELLTALLFVLFLDAFFVAQVRDGLSAPSLWLGDRIIQHWPILLAHLILVAGLIAVTGTDIQAYWVDVRVTGLITVAGMILLTIWSPGRPRFPNATAWWRPGDLLAAVCLTVATVRFLTWLGYDRRQDRAELDRQTDPDAESAGSSDLPGQQSKSDAVESAEASDSPILSPSENAESEVDGRPKFSNTSGAPALDESSDPQKKSHPISAPVLAAIGWLMLAVAIAVPVWVWLDRDAAHVSTGFLIRVVGILAGSFAALVAASVVSRETDDEIEEVIDEERVTARSGAFEELFRVMPALLAGLAVIALLLSFPNYREAWKAVWSWSPAGSWQPVPGLSTAVAGFVLAGGFAWGMRIFFTLLLGKEALGFGDVHLLAAAGAVAGPTPAVLSFFAGSLIALVGMAALLPVKRRRVIPFGPWLALGVITLAIAREPVVRYFEPALEAFELLLRSRF